MMHAGSSFLNPNPSFNNVISAGFQVGSNIGVSANVVIPAVATLTIVKGIITSVV